MHSLHPQLRDCPVLSLRALSPAISNTVPEPAVPQGDVSVLPPTALSKKCAGARAALVLEVCKSCTLQGQLLGVAVPQGDS